jgi:hypothetical protein
MLPSNTQRAVVVIEAILVGLVLLGQSALLLAALGLPA